MLREEREAIRKNAADNHKGNLEAAAADFIDATLEYKKAGGIPVGMEAGIGGIVWEVENVSDDVEEDSEPNSKALSRMTRIELLTEAERLGVSVPDGATNAEIIAAIE